MSSALAGYVADQRRAGLRIALTNGCFDVLHIGHVRYLCQARELADVLIVGLNSDESVRALKGQDRPINPEGDRAEVLAALSCVDRVEIFGERTPERLIGVVRPDVYVKGGDYDAALLPERHLVYALGGRVAVMQHVTGRSSSEIIARVRAQGTDWEMICGISD